jgi:rhamnosyltransferase
MKKPLISIIIVARDEEKNLHRCLEGVRAQEVDFGYEVVVVDSGSRDGTAEVARSFGARVIGIAAEEFQHGRTRQMASEAARGEYLVYLVADAVPADRLWLRELVAATAGDERVAGAYSRQVPRSGAGPIEVHRLKHRLSSGLVPEVRELSPAHDFWALAPEERFRFCEFDDVSCCRRRSALDRIPIPAVGWAEDLLWSREVLRAGFKIAYAPGSVVRHSHPDTVLHAFRRGFLDQDVVKREFGVIYFDGVGALARGYPHLWREQARAVLAAAPGLGERLKLLGWNSLRLAAEMKGNYFAAAEPRRAHVIADLTRPRSSQGQVLRTRFTLGADTRPTLFMNPDSAARTRVHIPAGARLTFGAGINPQARPFRRDPVRFIAAVDAEPVWTREIGPGRLDDEPRWVDASVDLSRWAGRGVNIMLITRAANTDYAWAGWGAPRVVVDELSLGDRIMDWMIDIARDVAAGRPLRHP